MLRSTGAIWLCMRKIFESRIAATTQRRFLKIINSYVKLKIMKRMISLHIAEHDLKNPIQIT